MTAANSFHTPESVSSSPMAIPSKRLCMERARTIRNPRTELKKLFSLAIELSDWSELVEPTKLPFAVVGVDIDIDSASNEA